MIKPVEIQNGRTIGYTMLCPGCDIHHMVYTDNPKPGGPSWGFNGDSKSPTFTPSILVRWEQGEEKTKKVCHSFIRNGAWEFLADCTHGLAGQKIPMIKSD